MQMIDDNTYMMRRTITNCGFPVNDTWSGDFGGIRWWGRDNAVLSAKNYKEISDTLLKCDKDTSSEAGKTYLEFLDNKVQCSICHMSALAKMLEVSQILKDVKPNETTPQQRQQVLAVLTTRRRWSRNSHGDLREGNA